MLSLALVCFGPADALNVVVSDRSKLAIAAANWRGCQPTPAPPYLSPFLSQCLSQCFSRCFGPCLRPRRLKFGFEKLPEGLLPPTGLGVRVLFQHGQNSVDAIVLRLAGGAIVTIILDATKGPHQASRITPVAVGVVDAARDTAARLGFAMLLVLLLVLVLVETLLESCGF